MGDSKRNAIPDTLVSNIPHRFLLIVEEHILVASQRALQSAGGIEAELLPYSLGYQRYIHVQQGIHRAFNIVGAHVSALSGNSILVGRLGSVIINHFNTTRSLLDNGRRSTQRRLLARVNREPELLMQSDLFHEYQGFSEIVICIIVCYAKSPQIHSEAPLDIYIAVPNQDMDGWLFKESLRKFLQRYNQSSATQPDHAKPKIKRTHIKKSGDK